MLHVSYAKVTIDVRNGDNRKAEFLALNPRGQVPVLADGDVVQWESTGALVYLARKHGGDSWLPVDAAGLAQVMQFEALPGWIARV